MVQRVHINFSLFPSYSELQGSPIEVIKLEYALSKKRLEVYSSFMPTFKRTKLLLDTMAITFPLLAVGAISVSLPYLAASLMFVFIPISFIQRHASERAAVCSVGVKRATHQWQQWGRVYKGEDLENLKARHLRKEDKAIYADFLPYIKYDLKDRD